MYDVLLNAFNTGEISPDLYGRVDIPKVQKGYKTLQNFYVNIQGTAYFRGGWSYALNAGGKKLTLDFTYSPNDAYTMELGNQTLRLIRDKKYILNEDGTVLELKTPYKFEDLFYENGEAAINKAQANDVVYLFCGKYPQMRLERFAENKFELVSVDYGADGGFEDLNTKKDKRVWVSARTGDITINATEPIFKAGHVDGLFYVAPVNFDGVYNWSEGRTVKSGQRIISDNKTYIAQNEGTTGYSKPTHTEGTNTDGGVNWIYEDPGYGVAKIKTVAEDGKSCTATVLNAMPYVVVGEDRKTYKWKFGSWCQEYGYPTHGCFHRERLVFGRDRRLWLSWTDDFENFAEYDFGKMTSQCGFSFNISTSRVTGRIQWLMSSRDLIVGTTTGIVSIGESSTSDVFYAGNVRSYGHTDDRCTLMEPVRVGQRLIFLINDGKKVKELIPTSSSYIYDSQEISQFAEHINVGGIIKMVHQTNPFDVVYCLKADGSLSCLLDMPEQEGLAWYRFKTDGFIESINLEGDYLVACVRRYVVDENGQQQEQHYIEYLEAPFLGFFDKTEADFENLKEYESYLITALLEPQKKANYLDSSVIIQKDEPFDTITQGLEHLAGRTVRIVSEGGIEPDQIVTLVNDKWSLKLQEPTRIAIIGLPYMGVIAPCQMEIQGTTAQFKTKRIIKVGLRLYNSMGGQAGPSMDKMTDILTRSGKDNLNNPIPLFSGDRPLEHFPGNYELGTQLLITQPYPLPFAIQGILYKVDVNL